MSFLELSRRSLFVGKERAHCRRLRTTVDVPRRNLRQVISTAADVKRNSGREALLYDFCDNRMDFGVNVGIFSSLLVYPAFEVVSDAEDVRFLRSALEEADYAGSRPPRHGKFLYEVGIFINPKILGIVGVVNCIFWDRFVWRTPYFFKR